MAPLQGLVWIAKTPQVEVGMAQAIHPQVRRPENEPQKRLGVIQRQRLLEVGPRRGQLSTLIQSDYECLVSPRKEIPVLDPLGQPHQLLRQFPCRLELPPVKIKQPQPKQHGEELRRLAQ